MNLRSLYFYSHEIRNRLGSDLHLFEVSVWIQAFAQSLITVFIPIILWKLGLGIKEIVAFYLIFNIFDIPLNLLARKLIEDYGAKAVIIISIVANLVYFVFLYNLSNNWLLISLVAFFLAIYDSFYWVSHLYIFVQAAHDNERLRNDVSTLNIIRIVGGMLAPLIGAFILIRTDERTLIFFTTFLMFSSLIPLFRMRHLVFKPEQKSQSIREFLSLPQEKINYLIQCFGAWETEVEDVIYPFFVFFAFSSIKIVSYVTIIIAFAGLLFNYITTRYSPKRNIYKIIAAGAFFCSIFWIFRLHYINSIGAAFLSAFLIEVSATFIQFPVDVAIFERGKNSDVLNSSTSRNMLRMVSRALLYLVLLFAADIFSFSYYFIIVAMAFLFVFSLMVSVKYYKRAQLVPEPVEGEPDF